MRDLTGSESPAEVLPELLPLRKGPADRRVLLRATLAHEPGEELSAAINEVLAQARTELSSILEAHGVRQLSVTAKSAGDRILEWDWSVQLTLILDGKLPR